MKKQAAILFLFSLILFIACSGTSAEHKILHEAADVHNEALKIRKEMDSNIEKLQSLRGSIQVQAEALSDEELKFVKSVEVLEKRLEYWNENHVEVPGFEHDGHDHSGHDHNHDHSHDHSHAPKYQLPASDMLIIQKEFRDSILAIKGKLESLLLNAPQ